MSSRGVEAYGEQTFCYVYLSAHARRGEDVQTAWGSRRAGSRPTSMRRPPGARRGTKAAALLGAAPCPSEKTVVVLTVRWRPPCSA